MRTGIDSLKDFVRENAKLYVAAGLGTVALFGATFGTQSNTVRDNTIQPGTLANLPHLENQSILISAGDQSDLTEMPLSFLSK